MSRILIVSDLDEHNQINGVVTVYTNLLKELKLLGHEVKLISLSDKRFKTISVPTYKEIKLALNPWKITQMIEEFKPHHIHIATEGSLGLFAGIYCRKRRYAFTSSYHTQLPIYVNIRFPFISERFVYRYLKNIHKGSKVILVSSLSMKNELINQGFTPPIAVWQKAVDTKVFYPHGQLTNVNSNKILLYVGRIAPEKNIQDFLDLPICATKYVVGDGPLLIKYKKQYANRADIIFFGAVKGEALRQLYVSADVLVFPSKTDVFGLVMLEAIACGTPIAAYPVTGAKDIVEPGVTGFLHEDLCTACEQALKLDRKNISNHALPYSWDFCTKLFLSSLVHIKE